MGERLMLTLARPSSRTDGAPLSAAARVEILMTLRDPPPKRPREIEAEPSLTWSIPAAAWDDYAQGRRLEVGLTLGRIAADLEMPGGAAALKGRRLSFIAEVADGRRSRSDPSDIETFAVCDPPPAPRAAWGRLTEKGLLLGWAAGEAAPGSASAPAGLQAEPRFGIYRAEAEGPIPETPLHTAEAGARNWLDDAAAAGRLYRYLVRAAGAGRCESADGPVVPMSRVDLFPPEPPQGLAAVAEQGVIRLFWRPSREEDLRGYRVYRADGPEAPFRELTREDLTTTSFVDRNVAAGVVYSYAVTARDGAAPPNESSYSDQAIETMRRSGEESQP